MTKTDQIVTLAAGIVANKHISVENDLQYVRDRAFDLYQLLQNRLFQEGMN